MFRLKLFGDPEMGSDGTEIKLSTFPEFIGDPNLQWYRHSYASSQAKRKVWDQGMVSWGLAPLYKHVIMWKEIKNWRYVPVGGGEVTILDRNYYFYPKQFGLDEWTMDIRQCVGYWQAHGWNLLWSEGPQRHPQVYVDYSVTNMGELVKGQEIDMSSLMRKLPDDWLEWKMKATECQKQKMNTDQEAMLMKVGADIARTILLGTMKQAEATPPLDAKTAAEQFAKAGKKDPK